jgi:transposase
LRSAFTKLDGDVRVHLESGELAARAHSVIKPLVSEVVLSHPRILASIAKDTNKTDAIDARKLA